MAAAGRPPRVEVEWDDARSIYEQLELSAAREKCRLVRRFSLGYLIVKDKERLVIAHTFDPAERKLETAATLDEDGGADFTVIPRGWVQSITELKSSQEEEPNANV